MRQFVSNVTSKGQVTIPAAVEGTLGLEPPTKSLLWLRTTAMLYCSLPSSPCVNSEVSCRRFQDEPQVISKIRLRKRWRTKRPASSIRCERNDFSRCQLFLRYLVEPDGPDNQARHEIAAALFEAIELGEEEATTSEAVLAEVAFILASKRQYNLPSVEIAAYLSPIIRLPGLRLPRGRKGLIYGRWRFGPNFQDLASWTLSPRQRSRALICDWPRLTLISTSYRTSGDGNQHETCS